MGDRVAVMKLGVLQQVDTPLKLYDKPVNLFVAGFIGSPQMNLMEGHGRRRRRPRSASTRVPVDPAAARKMEGNITVGVRPEAWRLVTGERGRPARQGHGRRGARRRQLRLRHQRRRGHPANVIVRVSRRDSVQKGETLHVTTDPQNVHVFDTETGERLSD